MLIRTKIVSVVIPLIITPLLLTGILSFYAARNGITSVAVQFLQFKAEQLQDYAQSQWTILLKNGLEGNPAFLQAARSAVESYAGNLIRNETELILAVDESGNTAMKTAEVEISGEEKQAILRMRDEKTEGWQQIRLSGQERVSYVTAFQPFGWTILVSQRRDSFYRVTEDILQQVALVLAVACLVSVLLLLLFSNFLVRPLRSVVRAMREIVEKNDLSSRVAVTYRDETGELGHTFNVMTGELETAHAQIKAYALKAVIAQHKEQKIRNIFEKYVPKEVIDQYFKDPESMLVGENRILAVLFSDVRGFTTLSEQMSPEQVIVSLNEYFGRMVDIIMARQGIVDKYMGDAIMAFFGAPVHHEDDPYQAVLAGLEMGEALKDFNLLQAKHKRPDFQIGIGINYGAVTVGNIGSAKKMDYTVIGDMVNVASRLEGLTKMFHEPMIVSESIYERVRDKVPCRLLGRVVLTGRVQYTGIYAPRRSFSEREGNAWKVYYEALDLYASRQFEKALQNFQEVQNLLPGDTCTTILTGYCQRYIKSPPPPEWQGLLFTDSRK